MTSAPGPCSRSKWRRVFETCYERLRNVLPHVQLQTTIQNMSASVEGHCIAKMVLFFDEAKTSEAVTCSCTRALLR